MPVGPGKYDPVLTQIREQTRARGAFLLILDGDQGDGFAVQMPLKETLALPSLLRAMADQIEEMRAGGIDL
jgi:hypothetical protein